MSKSQEKAYLREATYDKEANAIYVRVRDTKVQRTITALNGCRAGIVNVDLDDAEDIVGVEILL